MKLNQIEKFINELVYNNNQQILNNVNQEDLNIILETLSQILNLSLILSIMI